MFLCLPEQRRSVFIVPTSPSTGCVHWCYLGYCGFQSVHFAIALPLRISSCRDFHLEVHHIGAWQRSSRQTVIPFVSFHAKVAWSSSLDPFVLPPSALYPLKLLLGPWLLRVVDWVGWVGWGSGGFPGASLLGMYGLFLHYGSLVVILLDNFVLSPVKPNLCKFV